MDLKNYVINLRRQIHQNPELGFEEFETQKLIISELKKFKLDFEKKKTGVICEIGSGEETIIFRADMDALPVEEETNKVYASKIKGKMHACGHDNHVAILLGTIRETLKFREKLTKKVRFVFQPNEEGINGAAFMIKNGALTDNATAIFGLHVKSDLKVGTVGVKYDEMMAAVDEFKISLSGKGGHAGLPHLTQDVILSAADIVQSLNYIVSRSINPAKPATLSVCKIVSGTAFNIIPKNCEILGTIRTFDKETREIIMNKMQAIVENYAKAHDIKSNIQILKMGNALINDKNLVNLVKKTSEKVVGKKNVILLTEPCMGGEDFSEYLEKIPGCYFYLGVGNPKKNAIYDWHSPKFDIDEDALEIGVNIFVEIIKNMSC